MTRITTASFRGAGKNEEKSAPWSNFCQLNIGKERGKRINENRKEDRTLHRRHRHHVKKERSGVEVRCLGQHRGQQHATAKGKGFILVRERKEGPDRRVGKGSETDGSKRRKNPNSSGQERAMRVSLSPLSKGGVFRRDGKRSPQRYLGRFFKRTSMVRRAKRKGGYFAVQEGPPFTSRSFSPRGKKQSVMNIFVNGD